MNENITNCAVSTVAWIPALLWLAAVSPPAISDDSITRGQIHKSNVYTQSVDSRDSCLQLLQADLEDGTIRPPIKYIGSRRKVMQWRLEFGKLWSLTTTYTPLFTDNVYRFDLAKLKAGSLQTGRIPNDSDHPEPILRAWGPLSDLAILGTGLIRFTQQAYYDCIPISDETLRLFILTNNEARIVKQPNGNSTIEGDVTKESWSFKVYRYDAQWGPNPLEKKHMTWVEGKFTLEELIEVGFKEEFHAFASVDGNYHFVTESGKLYAAKRGAKGEARKLREAWVDTSSPITHLITDVDKSRTYAFGKKNLKDPEDIRFGLELMGERPQVFVHIEGKSMEPNTADEPMKTVLHYARFLRERDRIAEESRSLMIDKRLQPIMPLENSPELSDLLNRLAKKTGVTFALDKNLQDHRPVFDIRRKDAPAYDVMRMIASAQLVDGRWVKQGEGFLLTAKESTSAKAQAAKKAEDERQKAQEQLFAKERAVLEDFHRQFPLHRDIKFHVKVSFVGTAPPLRQVMDELHKATGVPLTLADNLTYHDPDFGIWRLPTFDAFRVMAMIAKKDLDNGHWVKTDTGYRLEGVSRALRPAPASRGWYAALGVGSVLLAAAGVLAWRRRKGTTRAAPSQTATT